MIDGDELELFAAAVRAATDRHSGAALDAALAELGWGDALAADPRGAVATLFEAQGRAGSTSCALGVLVATALGVEDPRGGGVLLPPLGSAAPPGRRTGEGIVVDGLGPAGLLDAEVLLVAVREGNGDAVVEGAVPPAASVEVVAVPAAGLELRPVTGIDPGAQLVEVRGALDRVSPAAQVDGWAEAVRLARLALAHELVGTARTMLQLARDHALDRVQFGRPIAAFQAVRHRLADALVAIEVADAMADAAWIDGGPATAATAKALAGRGARTAARHCQQVLAGIGFTAEHPFHRHLRRALLLDELLGSSRALTRRHGEDVLARRSLPPALPL